MQITQASVLGKFNEFYTKLKRPLCLADLRQAFNVAEKREAVRSEKVEDVQYTRRIFQS